MEKEVEFLKMHQDYAVVGTFTKIINENSKVIRLWDKPIEDYQIKKYFKKDNSIIHGSSMIRMKCLLDVGFYDESIEQSQDYELWLRISHKYHLANIPEHLYMWRVHNENIGAKCMEKQKVFVVLAMIKNNISGNKKATVQFINFIADKNMALLPRILVILFRFIKIITFRKIQPIMLLKFLIRIRFFKKINSILKDFEMNKIGFEDAKINLIDIINRRAL